MAHSTLVQDTWDRAVRRPDDGQRANLDLGSLDDETANGLFGLFRVYVGCILEPALWACPTRPPAPTGMRSSREHPRANSVLSLWNPNRRRKQRCCLAFRLFRRGGGSFTSR